MCLFSWENIGSFWLSDTPIEISKVHTKSALNRNLAKLRSLKTPIVVDETFWNFDRPIHTNQKKDSSTQKEFWGASVEHGFGTDSRCCYGTSMLETSWPDRTQLTRSSSAVPWRIRHSTPPLFHFNVWNVCYGCYVGFQWSRRHQKIKRYLWKGVCPADDSRIFHSGFPW